MKWNFECDARERDYLHDRFTQRCNDFRLIKSQSCGAGIDRTGANVLSCVMGRLLPPSAPQQCLTATVLFPLVGLQQ
jgi:hypothetical protein